MGPLKETNAEVREQKSIYQEQNVCRGIVYAEFWNSLNSPLQERSIKKQFAYEKACPGMQAIIDKAL